MALNGGTKMRVITICLLILYIIPAMSYAKDKPLRVALFPLSTAKNSSSNWLSVVNFAQASADDLGIELDVVYHTPEHSKRYIDLIESILSSRHKPDAFLAASYLGNAEAVIKIAEKYHVPVMMFNNSPAPKTVLTIGQPRQKYQYYIGQVKPDDYQLGYLLADHLITQYRQKNPLENIKMIGITGTRVSPESYSRVKGLTKASSQHQFTELLQVVYSDWSGSDAYRKSSLLIKRYPNIQIIWCASDLQALYSLKAINESNKNIMTGGIDWSADAMMSIKNGQLTASAGGQFTTAGYALALIYDYLNGRDFAYRGQVIFNVPGGVIHHGNIDRYYQLLTTRNWQLIDFTQYSKILRPDEEPYDFSIARWNNSPSPKSLGTAE